MLIDIRSIIVPGIMVAVIDPPVPQHGVVHAGPAQPRRIPHDARPRVEHVRERIAVHGAVRAAPHQRPGQRRAGGVVVALERLRLARVLPPHPLRRRPPHL